MLQYWRENCSFPVPGHSMPLWLLRLAGFSYLQPKFGELGAVLPIKGSLMCCNMKSTYSGLWKISSPVFLQGLEGLCSSLCCIFLWHSTDSDSLILQASQETDLFFFFNCKEFLKINSMDVSPSLVSFMDCKLSFLLATSFFLLVASLPTHVFASSNSEPFCMYELSSKEFLHMKCWERKLACSNSDHVSVSVHNLRGSLKVLLVARNQSFKSPLPQILLPGSGFSVVRWCGMEILEAEIFALIALLCTEAGDCRRQQNYIQRGMAVIQCMSAALLSCLWESWKEMLVKNC